MAEAVWQALVNPGAMKGFAPRVYRRIQDYVNDHPVLKWIIQFNSLATLLRAPEVGKPGPEEES